MYSIWCVLQTKCSGTHLFHLQVKHLRISCYCFVSATSSDWNVHQAVFILIPVLLPIIWFGKKNLAGIFCVFGDGIQLTFHNSPDSSELLPYIVKLLFLLLSLFSLLRTLGGLLGWLSQISIFKITNSKYA